MERNELEKGKRYFNLIESKIVTFDGFQEISGRAMFTDEDGATRIFPAAHLRELREGEGKIQTPTEKLYDLYAENKANHDKAYIEELFSQIELFATESNTLSRLWIQEELQKIIDKSKAIQ